MLHKGIMVGCSRCWTPQTVGGKVLFSSVTQMETLVLCNKVGMHCRSSRLLKRFPPTGARLSWPELSSSMWCSGHTWPAADVLLSSCRSDRGRVLFLILVKKWWWRWKDLKSKLWLNCYCVRWCWIVFCGVELSLCPVVLNCVWWCWIVIVSGGVELSLCPVVLNCVCWCWINCHCVQWCWIVTGGVELSLCLVVLKCHCVQWCWIVSGGAEVSFMCSFCWIGVVSDCVKLWLHMYFGELRLYVIVLNCHCVQLCWTVIVYIFCWIAIVSNSAESSSCPMVTHDHCVRWWTCRWWWSKTSVPCSRSLWTASWRRWNTTTMTSSPAPCTPTRPSRQRPAWGPLQG